MKMVRSTCNFAQLAIVLLGCCSAATLGQERYREPFRPQFHFTPAQNWMNDPNGMVFYDGEWHLFYQYNPLGDRWGHMSWGHAVSRDLVRWEHLPLALAEADGIMIFSGSAVVDYKNTSGFGVDDKPPLVAIYTGHREGRQDQRIAYSNDRGRTWTKFAGNPVLDVKMADFRDPKVFWHETTSRWVMTVALATEKKVHFYVSPDLKAWKYVGEFGPAGATDGLWECPDLFPLPVLGGGSKWVLIVNINPGGPAGGSGCQYFVGAFDGEKFTPDPLPAALAEFVPQGKLVADFESGYADWKADGDAFGNEPARGTLPHQQPVGGFKGERLVNSFNDGDRAQGTLTSPLFEITAKHLSFLIGGGAHEQTRVDLLVDGKAVRTARGRERERLAWQSWDVSELRGKKAEIQVIDKHSGGWGHINLDHILLADEPARPASEEALWADYGADFYAAVSWSDVPQSDGRRIWLGWMSNWNYANEVPTSPWRSAMSIPRELRLVKTAAGLRLSQSPVAELKSLRGESISFAGGTAAEANAWIRKRNLRSGPLELSFALEGSEGLAGVKLYSGKDQATTVAVDRQNGQVFIDRTRSGQTAFHPKFAGIQTAPLPRKDDRVALRIYADTSSVEVFVNDGEQVLTSLILPKPEESGIEFFAPEKGRFSAIEMWPLNRAW
jgi:sucrose-6-phosphate hydrolase SacC (GH32 family)